MNNDHGKYSGTALFFTFLGGAVVGAIAGILLTDRSGQETRWECGPISRRDEEEIKKAKEVRAALDEVIERGKVFITEKRAGTDASVTTGQEALKEAIENRPRAV